MLLLYINIYYLHILFRSLKYITKKHKDIILCHIIMVHTMKAFLLLASLSFASALLLVPHDGNETRTSISDAVIPENSTDTSNIFVNQSNINFIGNQLSKI